VIAGVDGHLCVQDTVFVLVRAEANVSGCRRTAFLHFPQAIAKGLQVFGLHEMGEGPSLELASGAIKEVSGLEVCPCNALILVDGEVSHGGEIVELPVAVKGAFELRLGTLELLVLELQFHLAHADFVEQSFEILDVVFRQRALAFRDDLFRPLSELMQFVAVFICH
jgi:hypothetical protein